MIGNRTSSTIRRIAFFTLWWMALGGTCASAVLLSGCQQVTVAGKQRPLVSHTPIQGQIEFEAEYLEDERTGGPVSRRGEATLFKEGVEVRTSGDVYHPNLLLYRAALGLALTQEEITADNRTERSTGMLDEYDLAIQLLRAKPYPVSFFTSKTEDTIARPFLGALRTDTTSTGFSWSLRSEEFPMQFSYDTSHSEQDPFTSIARDFYERDDERFRYTVSHDFSDWSRLEFDYEKNDVLQKNQNTTTDIDEDRYNLRHEYSFGDERQHRIESFFSHLKQTGTFSLENTSLTERMVLQHTPDLLTDYEVRYLESEQSTFDSRELFTRVGFEHTLYESLTTTGDLFRTDTDVLGQGEFLQQGGRLAFDYRKKNPLGALFATYALSMTETEQESGGGTGFVNNEVHSANALELVELERANIVIPSIRVKDEDGITLFQQGDDYEIVTANDRTFLRFFAIPQQGGAVPNFSEGQQVFVDYQFQIAPQRQEDTLRQDFTIRQQFDNGVSVYYRQQRQNEDISSNVAFITPDEFVTHTYGTRYSRGGLSLWGEYSERDSTIIPSTSRLVGGAYSWLLSEGLLANVHATQRWMEFGEPDAHDVDLFTLGGTLAAPLGNGYTLSSDVDYRLEDDTRFGETEGLEVNAALNYNYRQLSVETGVEFNTLQRRGDQLDNVLLFFRLSRMF